MKSIQSWLAKSPILNFILLLAYYLLVVLPHEQVGLLINKIFKPLPRSTYNQIILMLCLGLVFFLGLVFWKKIRVHPFRTKLLIGFGFTLAMMFLVNSFLFVINIESIHYVQYAVFVILLFPLVKNYFGCLFLATVAGAIDEAYQYFILAPERTEYYDFNDVITNLLGAAFGILILWVFQIHQAGKEENRFRKSFVIPVLVLTALMIGLILSPWLSIQLSEDTFALVKVKQAMWTTLPPNETFHVVGPLEGMIYLVFLFGVYFVLFEYNSLDEVESSSRIVEE